MRARVCVYWAWRGAVPHQYFLSDVCGCVSFGLLDYDGGQYSWL